MLQSKTKKMVFLAGGAGLAALVIGGGVFAWNANQYTISQEEAQTIALEQAGVNQKDVTFTRINKEMEDWKKTYEIEFHTASGEYDFTIDGQTGSVIERDVEIYPTAASSSLVEASSNQAVQTASSTSSSQSQLAQVAETKVTQAKAKEVALQHAGLTEDKVTALRIHLDTENGQAVYEVDFQDTATGLDYDYTISATTAEIVETSKEAIVDND